MTADFDHALWQHLQSRERDLPLPTGSAPSGRLSVVDSAAVFGKAVVIMEQFEASERGSAPDPSPIGRRFVQKVVAYVVHQERLLVFAHDDVALEVTGVQVPAGTIESDEQPEDAATREVREEAGIDARVVSPLGATRYDCWPSKPEVHERHFFLLSPVEAELPERWRVGEESPSGGGPVQSWTCWWQQLGDAHVLSAGFGARIGGIEPHVTDPSSRS